MDTQQIIKTVNETLAEEFELEAEQMLPEAHLINDLGLDSLDYVDMVIALQNAFGMKLRDEQGVRDIRTLQDIYNFIESKRDQLA